jgi:hypothetical protein
LFGRVTAKMHGRRDGGAEVRGRPARIAAVLRAGRSKHGE